MPGILNPMDGVIGRLKKNFVKREEICEELKYIEGSVDDYISSNGIVYSYYGNNNYYPKKSRVNKECGYAYAGVRYPDKTKGRRINILVAKAFIPNPDNLPIVGHKDNVKTNNTVENLYWTTYSENTKKAFDDGLVKNDSGFDDNQSMPVYVFNLNKEIIDVCGSITIASKKYNVSKHCVCFQCYHEMKTKPRKGYYYRFKDEYDKNGFID